MFSLFQNCVVSLASDLVDYVFNTNYVHETPPPTERMTFDCEHREAFYHFDQSERMTKEDTVMHKPSKQVSFRKEFQNNLNLSKWINSVHDWILYKLKDPKFEYITVYQMTNKFPFPVTFFTPRSALLYDGRFAFKNGFGFILNGEESYMVRNAQFKGETALRQAALTAAKVVVTQALLLSNLMCIKMHSKF
jgi:hypothetical protein